VKKRKKKEQGEHVCDATVPVCSCGRRWEFMSAWSNGSVTYTSQEVYDKFRTAYGMPDKNQFIPVHHARRW
jgi:hypothetical protein